VGDEHGVRVVRNYGDPAGEYEAARNDVAVVERTDRSILRAHGRDPVKMVQGLVTNDVANAPETARVCGGAHAEGEDGRGPARAAARRGAAHRRGCGARDRSWRT
jgi:glycine cleavage system aminomethyltransferase T